MRCSHEAHSLCTSRENRATHASPLRDLEGKKERKDLEGKLFGEILDIVPQVQGIADHQTQYEKQDKADNRHRQGIL